jgi:uncharacterized protein (DUF2236 family)
MLSLMFGDPVTRAAAVARIRGIHTTVNGTLSEAVGPFPRGTRYSAEDPALLLWVHATLVDSSADIYARLVAPLSALERDALCREAAPLLHELGGDPAATPLTWDALQSYLVSIYASDVLTVSTGARTLGEAVLSPRASGLVVPLTRTQAALTIGLLPQRIREAYGFEWTPTDQQRFDRNLARLRAIRRRTPRLIAHWRQARA